MKKLLFLLSVLCAAPALAGTAGRVVRYTSPTVQGNSVLADDGFAITMTSSGTISTSSGTVDVPGYGVTGDANTGVYFPANNTMAFTVGGNEAGRFNLTAGLDTQFLMPGTSPAVPQISVVGDTDTGILFNALAPNYFELWTGGARRQAIANPGTTFYPAGSAAAPTLSLNDDFNTGFFRSAANVWSFSSAGTLRMSFSSASLLLTVPILGGNGTVTSPAMSFLGDPNTGVYNFAADTLGFAAGGVVAATMSAAGFTATGVISSTSGVNVGVSGTTITRHLSATASLNFGATAAGACDLLTITVTGAADGNTVVLGVPSALAASDNYQSFEGYVSAADTVTVKRCNLLNLVTALSDPAAATVRADVWQH